MAIKKKKNLIGRFLALSVNSGFRLSEPDRSTLGRVNALPLTGNLMLPWISDGGL
jgi:hypothetical protein